MGKRSRSARKRRLRVALYHLQKEECFWCGSKTHFSASTLDHVIPKVLGGSNHRRNFVMACKRCNSSRSGAFTRWHLRFAHPDELKSAVLKAERRMRKTLEHLEKQPTDPQQTRIVQDLKFLLEEAK